jgi:hypothetical protein
MRTTLWYSPSPIRARPHLPTFCTGGHAWEFPTVQILLEASFLLVLLVLVLVLVHVHVQLQLFPAKTERRKPEAESRSSPAVRDSWFATHAPTPVPARSTRKHPRHPPASDGSAPPPPPIPRSHAPASTGMPDAVRSAVPTAPPWSHGRVEFCLALSPSAFHHGIDQRQQFQQE